MFRNSYLLRSIVIIVLSVLLMAGFITAAWFSLVMSENPTLQNAADIRAESANEYYNFYIDVLQVEVDASQVKKVNKNSTYTESISYVSPFPKDVITLRMERTNEYYSDNVYTQFLAREFYENFTFLTLFQTGDPLELEQAVEIAFWVDRLADSIENMYPQTPRNREEAFALSLEIAPYAVYERILPEEFYNELYAMRVKSREILPDIEIVHYGGDANFHLLGTAQCYDLEDPVFNMTLRYYNPFSPWYRRTASQVTTLIHELLHMQGICSDFSKGDEYNRDVESATQIATLEVLAAMTRHGNSLGLLPFLRDIEDYAADVVLLWAVENDDLDYYRENILNRTANDAYRLAGFEKSMAYWFSTYALRFELVGILNDYGVKPYEYLVEALNAEDYMTRKLPFPNKKRIISVDDTAYVLEHIAELMQDYPKILR